MILLKIFSGPLIWESSSISIILRFGVFIVFLNLLCHEIFRFFFFIFFDWYIHYFRHVLYSRDSLFHLLYSVNDAFVCNSCSPSKVFYLQDSFSNLLRCLCRRQTALCCLCRGQTLLCWLCPSQTQWPDLTRMGSWEVLQAG